MSLKPVVNIRGYITPLKKWANCILLQNSYDTNLWLHTSPVSDRDRIC